MTQEGLDAEVEALQSQIDQLRADLDQLRRDHDTQVANLNAIVAGIIGCFDGDSTFSITIPEIVFPRIRLNLPGELPTVTVTDEFTLVPEQTIGVPVFGAPTLISCLGSL